MIVIYIEPVYNGSRRSIMKTIENRWGQSFSLFWLPAVLAGCHTENTNRQSHIHPTIKNCSMTLFSPRQQHNQPHSKKTDAYFTAYHHFFMPWIPCEAPEEPKTKMLIGMSHHAPNKHWADAADQQNPLWKKYGHEVCHFLGVPGLEKHEHRLGTSTFA